MRQFYGRMVSPMDNSSRRPTTAARRASPAATITAAGTLHSSSRTRARVIRPAETRHLAHIDASAIKLKGGAQFSSVQVQPSIISQMLPSGALVRVTPRLMVAIRVIQPLFGAVGATPSIIGIATRSGKPAI